MQYKAEDYFQFQVHFCENSILITGTGQAINYAWSMYETKEVMKTDLYIWETKRDRIGCIRKTSGCAIVQSSNGVAFSSWSILRWARRSTDPQSPMLPVSSLLPFRCSLLYPWNCQWYPAYPRKASSASAYALMFVCLRVAFNECPPQNYIEHANRVGRTVLTLLHKITNFIQNQIKISYARNLTKFSYLRNNFLLLKTKVLFNPLMVSGTHTSHLL